MSIPETENNRVYLYLAKIAGKLVDTPLPRTRLERFLAKLAGIDVEVPSAPYDRLERFLLACLGLGELPTDTRNRLERYLNHIAGGDADKPSAPYTMLERYLDEIELGTEYTYEGNLPTEIVGRIIELIRYGKCTQAAAPTPTNPADIVCNNGAIKCSMNMANVNSQTVLTGYYINGQGVVTADVYNWLYQAFIPVKPNTTYTLSMSSSVYFISISEYSTAEDSGFVVRKTGSTGTNLSITITTGANTNYIRFGANLDRTQVTLAKVLAIDWMLNVGSTAKPYQPYVAGGIYIDGTAEVLTVGEQTFSVPNILSVGDVKDDAEIISGVVDRAIVIRRVSSDWSWLLASGTGYKQFYTSVPYVDLKTSVSCMSNIAPYGCTAANRTSYQHGCYTGGTGNLCFQMIGEANINTVNDWKTFLDNNEVYFVAALAEGTTEEVTPQHISSSGAVSSTTNTPPAETKITYIA